MNHDQIRHILEAGHGPSINQLYVSHFGEPRGDTPDATTVIKRLRKLGEDQAKRGTA